MPSRCTHAVLIAVGVALCAAAVAPAQDFEFPTTKPVPPHGQPWVETAGPDIRTVVLWKFITAADRDKAAADVLEKGSLDDLLDEEEGPLPTPGGKAEGGGGGKMPKLVGKAAIKDAAGRFGGGLTLDGTGYAEGTADLPGLVAHEGGFTIDGWFRPAKSAPNDMPQTLVAIPDRGGRPLMAVVLASATSVVLSVEGTNRITVPVATTADGWHHFTLVVDVPRGAPDQVTLVMMIDGRIARADRPSPEQGVPWTKGVLGRIVSRLTVGGADGQPGLAGAIDEVRISKGVFYLYPWNLGRLELARKPEAIELKAPYFKSGSVLTRFHFDGSLEPKPFAGRSWAGKADAKQFKPGVQGQALDLSAIDKTDFAMKGFDILPDKNGTVEFWFRPLDWNNFYAGDWEGRDVKINWLMTLTAKDAIYNSASKNIEVRLGRSGQDGAVRWQKIHPGTWTHVLFSVKEGSPTVYVNGQRQRLRQAGLVTRGHPHGREPLEKWRERTGGKDIDDTWTLAFTKSPTLVDEFSVFNWAMDPNEAWNAYARWLPDAAEQMKPLPAFQTQFDYFAHSWDRKEKLVATVGCLPVGDVKPASADLEIRTAAGEVLMSAEKQALDEGGTAKFTIDKSLPFGLYPAVVRSRDASGKVLKEEETEYVREKPEWLGNTLGKERTIPKPWTPIKANGQSLELIGRRIELGKGGLPEKIETLGRQMLARPIAMRAAGPGGDAALAGEGMKLGTTADDRVEWKAALAGAGIKADVDAWLEFDGLLYCTVTLKPASGAEATLDELKIDVPLVANEATQLLANGGGPDFRNSWIATMVPAGEGSVWRSSDKPYPSFVRADGVTNFMPHIWLGADDVGLYFGAENDQGWTVDGPNPAQEILREKDAVVFRMNVIREATKIPAAGRRFHFILLPTPAKPEPVDWRKQMAAGGVNFGSCDSFGGFDMKTDPTDPMQGDDFRLEPRSWDHAAAMAPQCRAKWGRCILYADASFPRMGPAFRDWDHDLFATGRCAWTPECEDYAVWAVNEFLKRGVIDGVYWDDVSVGNTYSLDSTAYEYAGSKNGRRVGFTTLALRRMNMRLWRLFEAAGREPCIWAHMTVCYEVPLFSFCRYLSNGEFVTGVEPYGKRDAMDFWKPETLRILGPAAKWGAGVNFLTTLPRTLPPGPAAKQWAFPQQRAEDALYATSGIQTLSEGLTRKLVTEKVYDQPLRVFPWWQADKVVKVAAAEKANVLSAVYATDNRAIVFVSNFDRDVEREVTVELDLAALFPNRKAGGTVAWRDLDPGLDPPKVDVASAADIKKETAAAANAGLDAKERPLDEDEIGDFLEGTTPESRAKGRMELKVEGAKARITVRPRDYRVLEAKPGG